MQTNANVSAEEIARFEKLASRWWDPDGELVGIDKARILSKARAWREIIASEEEA